MGAQPGDEGLLVSITCRGPAALAQLVLFDFRSLRFSFCVLFSLRVSTMFVTIPG
jgi:hypothetical protein